MCSTSRMIQLYIALKDEKDAIEAAHKERLKPINETLERLEGAMMAKLNENNEESVKCEFGTIFKKKWTSLKIKDWGTVLGRLQKENRLDLIQAKLLKNETIDFMKQCSEQGQDVVGLETESGYDLGYRRA